MRAVIWTDVFQYLVMMGGILAILIKVCFPSVVKYYCQVVIKSHVVIIFVQIDLIRNSNSNYFSYLLQGSLVSGGFGNSMATMSRENRLNWIE